MAKYLHLYESASTFDNEYWGDSYLEPWVSYTEENGEVNYNKHWADYLTFEVLSDGFINLRPMVADSAMTLQTTSDFQCMCYEKSEGQEVFDEAYLSYSKNGGPWVDMLHVDSGRQYASVYLSYDEQACTVPVTAGDIVRFKGNFYGYSQHFWGFDLSTMGNFNTRYFPNFGATTCEFNLKGSLISLLTSDESKFDGQTYSCTVDTTNWGSSMWGTENFLFGLFYGCTGLNEVHDFKISEKLFAPYLFNGCTNLNRIEVNCGNSTLSEGPEVTGYTPLTGNENWVANVAANGTFVCPADAQWENGDDGIPDGWTVIRN